MAQTTYEIVGSYNDKSQTAYVCEILCQVMINAVNGYNYSVDRLQATAGAQGRIRVTLSDAFPQAEVDSFRGAIIVV
jgi:hypothetical protein